MAPPPGRRHTPRDVTTGLGWNPWTALLLAFVIGVAVAALVEWRVLRGLYARPLDTILATWGLNIIVVQLITLHFGESAIGRAMNVGGVTYSEYRLVLLLLAVVLGVAVWLVMQRTQIGIVARAVIMNEELAQALGINTRLVRFVTFGLGAGLAALAGALLTPLISVHPNLGVPWLINAFMLVLVAGVSAPEPGACRARSRRRAGARQLVWQSGARQPHDRDPGRDHSAVPHDHDLSGLTAAGERRAFG